MNDAWTAHQQNIADQWNAAHGKEEVAVNYWPGIRGGAPQRGMTRPFGAVLMGGTAVVYVYGAGAIALTHIEVQS